MSEQPSLTREYITVTNRRIRVAERQIGELAKRVDLLERLADDPSPIIRKYGIPAFNDSDQLSTLMEIVTDAVADKIVEKRRGKRERRTDHIVWRISAIASPLVAAVAVIVTIILAHPFLHALK